MGLSLKRRDLGIGRGWTVIPLGLAGSACQSGACEEKRKRYRSSTTTFLYNKRLQIMLNSYGSATESRRKS